MKIGLIADEISVEKGTATAKYTQKLYFHLKREGIEVKLIHTRSPRTILGAPIKHCIKLPYRVVRCVNGCDVVHAVTTIAGLCFPLLNRPRILTCHDTISLSCPTSGFPLHVRLFSPLFLRAGMFSEKVITVSTLSRNDLLKLGIKKSKIVVIPQGVDEELRPSQKKSNAYHTVGYLGTLMLRKRVDYLIRAFWHLRRKYPRLRAKLLICGGKRYEYQSLVGLVQQLGLSKDVHFSGFVQDLVQTYNLFDVFVFPSEYEGFGLPILEAQKCGVPVIVRTNASIPEEVRKFCSAAKSCEHTADRIHELLTNESLRKEMIHKGLQYANQFTWEKTCAKTLQVYEEMRK